MSQSHLFCSDSLMTVKIRTNRIDPSMLYGLKLVTHVAKEWVGPSLFKFFFNFLF